MLTSKCIQLRKSCLYCCKSWEREIWLFILKFRSSMVKAVGSTYICSYWFYFLHSNNRKLWQRLEIKVKTTVGYWSLRCYLLCHGASHVLYRKPGSRPFFQGTTKSRLHCLTQTQKQIKKRKKKVVEESQSTAKLIMCKL